MKMLRLTRWILVLVIGPACLGTLQPAAADYVEIEKTVAKPSGELAEKLTDLKVVVAARELSKAGAGWAAHQAASYEVTAALRRAKVDAIRAAADTRLDKLELARTPFALRDLKLLKDVGRTVLVGLEWTSTPKLKLKIVAWKEGNDKPLWSEQIELSRAAGDMNENVPPRNLTLIQSLRRQEGNKIGNGDAFELADEGLKTVSTVRRGFYRWGRELGPREPWLPGDILQLEKVEYKFGKRELKMNHHTVVIDEVKPEEIIVLHQNTIPKGKVVQRDTWVLKGLINPNNDIAAFRPWEWPEEVVVPIERPLRFVATKSTSKGATIDLLKVLDTRLDRVHGVWYFEGKNLRSQREFAARLQIPIDLPQAYKVRLKVERIEGTEQLGLGVVVDGKQTMVTIDAGDGQVLGLNQLDDKPAAENEAAKMGSQLPVGKKVEIECLVESGHIAVQIDGKPTWDWKGDASRLSVGSDYTVPQTEWLFLSATNTLFEISSLSLEPMGGK